MILRIVWTDAARRVIGFMVGLDFLSTGMTLMLLARVSKPQGPYQGWSQRLTVTFVGGFPLCRAGGRGPPCTRQAWM
jgi:hypothetical protein